MKIIIIIIINKNERIIIFDVDQILVMSIQVDTLDCFDQWVRMKHWSSRQ